MAMTKRKEHAPRVSRVRGVLHTLTLGTRTLALRMGDGRILRGVAGPVALHDLEELLGTEVVLEGIVTFRPSGEALRIEVESAFPATPGDVIWAHLPRAEPASARPRASATPSGLDTFFGRWPGDESDEQLAAAMKGLS